MAQGIKTHNQFDPIKKATKINGCFDPSNTATTGALLDRVMNERPVLGRLIEQTDIARVRRAHSMAALGYTVPQIDFEQFVNSEHDDHVMPVDTFISYSL